MVTVDGGRLSFPDERAADLVPTCAHTGPRTLPSNRPVACLQMTLSMAVLVRPQPSTDYSGVFPALLAAACWAGYILVNRVVGARLPGSQGPAAAAGLSALPCVPVGIWALASHPVTVAALGRAAAAGCCTRPSRWWLTCWRCAGSRPGSSVSS